MLMMSSIFADCPDFAPPYFGQVYVSVLEHRRHSNKPPPSYSECSRPCYY